MVAFGTPPACRRCVSANSPSREGVTFEGRHRSLAVARCERAASDEQVRRGPHIVVRPWQRIRHLVPACAEVGVA